MPGLELRLEYKLYSRRTNFWTLCIKTFYPPKQQSKFSIFLQFKIFFLSFSLYWYFSDHSCWKAAELSIKTKNQFSPLILSDTSVGLVNTLQSFCSVSVDLEFIMCYYIKLKHIWYKPPMWNIKSQMKINFKTCCLVSAYLVNITKELTHHTGSSDLPKQKGTKTENKEQNRKSWLVAVLYRTCIASSNLMLLWVGCPLSQQFVHSSWQSQQQYSWHRKAWSRRIPFHRQPARVKVRQSPYEDWLTYIGIFLYRGKHKISYVSIATFKTYQNAQNYRGGGRRKTPFSPLFSLHSRN